jgi:hypothetical protein
MEDKLKTILQDADRNAGPPAPLSSNLTAVVRRRLKRRRLRITVISAAAVILIAAGVCISLLMVKSNQNEQKRIAMLEAEVQRLQASTDATLRLVNELMETERRQKRLTELRDQLASIPDPMETMQMEIEGAASVLLYEADKMYRLPEQEKVALAKYNRLIKLFPDTHSAKTAKARLAEIEIQSTNKKDMKI